MVAVPVTAVLAMPLVAMAATFTLEDVHATCVVRFCVLPSLKFPVAVNCCELPSAMLEALGVTVIDVSVALVTVNDAVPTWPANTAVTVAFPGASPVANPFDPDVSLTVATDAGADVQETEVVRSCVLPSANVPIARNEVAVFSATLAAGGVTCMEVNDDESTTKLAEPVTGPC
jgi:hypothetical protein